MLQYLRGRSTYEHGDVAPGFIGVASDVAEQHAQPVTPCLLVPAAHGQAGYCGVHAFVRFFRDWSNEWDSTEKEFVAWWQYNCSWMSADSWYNGSVTRH